MRSLGPWVSVLVVSLGAAAAPAQSYTIKLKSHPDPGTTVTVRERSTETGSLKFFGPDGKLLNEVPPVSREATYAETVLVPREGGGKPVKYKRVYERATETIDGKTRVLSYQGRTVVFERRGGEYWVGVAGEPPAGGKDLDRLVEKVNGNPDSPGDRDITPDKPVAVGERWAIDPKVIGAAMKGYDLDLKASRATVRLVKVYARRGSRFGVLEVNLSLAVKDMSSLVTFDPPATLEQRVTIEAAIDGSTLARTETESGARLTGTGVVRENGRAVRVEADMGESGKTEWSEQADDPSARVVPAVTFVGPGGWAEFASEDGRFTAAFPGKPRVTTKKLDKGVVMNAVQATCEHDRIAYQVTYTDYLDADPKVTPETMIRGVAAATEGEVKEKREFKRNGHAGIEVVAVLTKGGTEFEMTYQLYYIRGRLYQVLAMGTRDVKGKIEARKFLDSFRLHEEKGGAGADKPGGK